MEDHHIMDAQLMASSYTSSTTEVYPPWAARLHMPWTELGATLKGIWATAANKEWVMVSRKGLDNMANVRSRFKVYSIEGLENYMARNVPFFFKHAFSTVFHIHIESTSLISQVTVENNHCPLTSCATFLIGDCLKICRYSRAVLPPQGGCGV